MSANPDSLEGAVFSIIQDALCAPSGDNCQPWRFDWDGGVLRVFHSEARARHELNRRGHASLLALGGLIEAIRISASTKSLLAEVSLPLEASDELSLWAEVRFRQAAVPMDPLAPAIPKRCTDRRPFRGGTIGDPVFGRIAQQATGHPGCRVQVRDTSSSELIDYFVESERLLWRNGKIFRDLSKWLRLTRREAAARRDGMSWKNIWVTPVEALTLRIIRWMPRTLGLFLRLGLGAQTQALMRKLIRSSAGLVCVTIKTTDRNSYYEAGRLAYRTWLMLNAQGYGVQPLSYASTGVADQQAGALSKDTSPEEREHFSAGLNFLRHAFELKEGEIPVWIFRTGLSPELPQSHRTPRLTLQECLLKSIRPTHQSRPFRRHPVALPVVAANQDCTIVNVSRKGVGMISRGALERDWNQDTLKVDTGAGDPVSLRVKFRWQRTNDEGESCAGFEILDAPPAWEQFLDRLEGPTRGR